MCQINETNAFKRKTPKEGAKNEYKDNLFDVTPIKNVQTSNFDNSLINQDLNDMLNDLKKESTKDTDQVRLSEIEPTTQEKADRKGKSALEKIKLSQMIEKNQKIISDAIKARQYDALKEKLKIICKRPKSKKLFRKEVLEMIEPKKNKVMTKPKSKDIKTKMNKIIHHSRRKKSGTKAEKTIQNFTMLKTENPKINLKKFKYMQINKKQKKQKKEKEKEKEKEVNFKKRKNSPLMTQRNKNWYKFLRKYKTVDLSNNVENQLNNTKPVKSPRKYPEGLTLKSIKSNLKNSSMKSLLSQKPKKQAQLIINDEYGEHASIKKKNKKKTKLISPRAPSRIARLKKISTKTTQSPTLKSKLLYKNLFK